MDDDRSVFEKMMDVVPTDITVRVVIAFAVLIAIVWKITTIGDAS
jgi:hypothetical protein